MQTPTSSLEDPPVADLDDRPDPAEWRPAPFAFLNLIFDTGWLPWVVIGIAVLSSAVPIALSFGVPIVFVPLAAMWLILTGLAVLGMTIWDSQDLVKLAVGSLLLLEAFGWFLGPPTL